LPQDKTFGRIKPERRKGMGTLYFGDNLDILREHIADDSIDLIYLDPPFNSKRV
jgi:16S rRNA G966 N2-methylase RsmD